MFECSHNDEISDITLKQIYNISFSPWTKYYEHDSLNMKVVYVQYIGLAIKKYLRCFSGSLVRLVGKHVIKIDNVSYWNEVFVLTV